MKNKSAFRLASSLFVLLSTVVISVPAAAHSRQLSLLLDKFVYGVNSSYCYDLLDKTTYNSGFSTSDFDSVLSVDIVNGKIVLNTDQRALGDTNRIRIHTRQELAVKYVYESADQSQTLGWFLWDDRTKKYTTTSGWTYTKVPCNSNGDCDYGESCLWCGSSCASPKVCSYPRRVLRDTGVDGTGGYNGVYDFFEKVWSKPGGSTNVYTKPSMVEPFPTSDPYSYYWWYGKPTKLWLYDRYHLNGSSLRDGGTYPRISNFIENLIDTGGGWLYLLADDDRDYQTTVTCLSWDYWYGYCAYAVQHWQWGSFYLPPMRDNVWSFDGVPDYDVNGDGSVNSLDRTVDMGSFDAGSELVFLLNSYYRNTVARYGSVGMRKHWSYWYPTVRVGSMPYFSKTVLNPDYKSTSTNFQRSLDIGCSYTTNSGYPGHTCGGVLGWLDKAAIDRLNTSAYNWLVLPHEVKQFYTIERGQRSHVFLGAPSNDPTRWILGFEQLYDGGAGGEMNYGNDYNDVVILINRQNGGEVVSDVVSTEIPPGQVANSTITKVRIKKDDYIPIPPCTPEPDTRIDYYISIGTDSHGDDVWYQIEFPPGEDEVTVDLSSLGLTGANLKWKVEIISSNEHCHPEVRDVDIGYEALVGGDYSFSTPLPLGNAMFKGTLETPSSSWTITGNDSRNRGHYYLYELYDPSNTNATNVTKKWDAGYALSIRNPDTRHIYTQQGMSKVEFKASTASSWMLNEILSNTDRNEKNNGKRVYDLNADGYANDNDARQIMRWTRGWEYPIGANTGNSVPRRAWPLGAIHRSTGAIVTPPGVPHWFDKPGIPPAVKSSYNTWMSSTARTERPTIAVVGAQDGMVHAFVAGSFRQGDDPSTPDGEKRGYFKRSGGVRDYGNGSELWAWIPPVHLNNLKNNYYQSYYPETHPWAMVDGSFSLADVQIGTQWKTVLFYTHGVNHPYVSALDVTDTQNPQPLWSQDWTSSNFNGTYQPPALAWFNSTKYGGNGHSWVVATTSGMSDTYGDVYLFLIDADDGSDLPYGKIKMNTGGGNSGQQALGVWGSPVAIDADQDGYVDRFYLADTNGRVWKHYMDGTNHNRCLVADVGPEPIYVTPAFKVAKDQSTGQNVVAFYFGTSDKPDSNDTPNPPYNFYAFVDRDTGVSCSSAELIYKFPLPPDEKVWADAFISGDEVYVGTSTGDKADICNEDTSNPGTVYSFSLEADNNGLPVQNHPSVSAGGNVVSGIIAFDEHLFLNSLGGKTKILGGDKWNNDTGGMSASASYEDLYWKEF